MRKMTTILFVGLLILTARVSTVQAQTCVPSILSIGSPAKVTQTEMYSGAATTTELLEETPSIVVDVIGGPDCSSGKNWWKIETLSGEEGWVPETALVAGLDNGDQISFEDGTCAIEPIRVRPGGFRPDRIFSAPSYLVIFSPEQEFPERLSWLEYEIPLEDSEWVNITEDENTGNIQVRIKAEWFVEQVFDFDLLQLRRKDFVAIATCQI